MIYSETAYNEYVMTDVILTVVKQGAENLNITLPPGAGAALTAYYDFLTENSRKFNLTAITGAEEVANLHFLDSIALLCAADYKSKKVLDVGSGAGFPGIPLKIAEPSIDLTLLEATGKKVTFLSKLCEHLALKAECVNARAEEAAHLTDFRSKYDIVVSRALAKLNILSELCLPFVKTGGMFIAMKSIDSDDEIDEAMNGLLTLGATFERNYDYIIPKTDITRRAVVIKKDSITPEKYPRRFAKIQKAPL